MLYEGDTPSNVFYLKKGAVKVYDIDSEGNEKVLAILKEGDILPIVAIFDKHNTVRCFYSTLNDCTLVAIDREVFIKELSVNARLGFYFIRWLGAYMDSFLTRMSSLERTDTGEKLNAALLMLAEQHSSKRLKGWYRVNFPVNQQLIADMIGVTRESVNGAVQGAEHNGIIRIPRTKILEIHLPTLRKCL